MYSPLQGLTLVAATSLVWMVGAMLIGFRAVRWSDETLVDDGFLMRIRAWERTLHFYRGLVHIQCWKDSVPEFGDFFKGGVSKRSLRNGSPDTLVRFVFETRRAERCHWRIVAFGLTFPLWTDWWFALINLALAAVINLPFIAIQRYNRIRLERALVRSGASHRIPGNDDGHTIWAIG